MRKVSQNPFSLQLRSYFHDTKASNSFALLLVAWTLGLVPRNLKPLRSILTIVVGVAIASIGEIEFRLTDLIYNDPPVLLSGKRHLGLGRGKLLPIKLWRYWPSQRGW